MVFNVKKKDNYNPNKKKIGQSTIILSLKKNYEKYYYLIK